MERYEANEWESYVAGVEIDAFGQQCAEEIMVAEVGIWLRDFKAGKITQPEYHNNLKKSGLENWSEEELKDFSVYKLSNMRERLREEDSESWQKYCCRGEKYMRTTIKGLEKLQNEIYDYALKIKHGENLVELKRRLNKAVGYKGIELITISRPTAYVEYAPYQFIDTEQEFEQLVRERFDKG